MARTHGRPWLLGPRKPRLSESVGDGRKFWHRTGQYSAAVLNHNCQRDRFNHIVLGGIIWISLEGDKHAPDILGIGGVDFSFAPRWPSQLRRGKPGKKGMQAAVLRYLSYLFRRLHEHSNDLHFSGYFRKRMREP